MKRWIIAGVILLLSFSTPASAQYIGSFTDPSAASCAADVGTQPWINLYVVMILEGELMEATGTQFQITGMPASWNPQNVLWAPDIGVTISLGHPMFPGAIYEESGGLNVAFGTCQTPQSGQVALGRLVLLGAPTPENVHLVVEAVELVPPDPKCPFVLDCTPPPEGFNLVCVSGGEIVLNGFAPQTCQVVAIEQTTWSAVRILYR